MKKKRRKKILRPAAGSAPKKRGRGQPSPYLDTYPELAYQQCLCGATDVDLAEFFEISEATLYLWKKTHPEFSESIKRGKQYADGKVANAMYLRAIGYSHPEEKIFCDKGSITRAKTTKHYPPDATSGIFWLKNRQRDKWHDNGDDPPQPPNINILAILIERAEQATRLLPSELRQLTQQQKENAT